MKIFKPHLLPNNQPDLAEKWSEAFGHMEIQRSQTELKLEGWRGMEALELLWDSEKLKF